ncbi:MarR family winged helix-turn-helix transcriptional regulator [Streptomyces sp. NPDC059816]|uniref:MarR family winged helix-turn-helix transcriptional regulator n=1 Tax=Streptomyces sp. NPDC059816 TaxID=3346960 RepID=UPI0036657C8B
MGDNVDRVLAQWRAEKPGLDATPMGVIGRIQRAARLLERELSEQFATHGLQLGEFDILATLLRSGTPYRLTAGALSEASMISSGAMTNRLNRLVAKDLVTRETDPDNRRSLLITLTPEGHRTVEAALVGHLATESQLLAPLDAGKQDQLAGLLRELLTGLGDVPRGPQ